jgi:hypothetical protein
LNTAVSVIDFLKSLREFLNISFSFFNSLASANKALYLLIASDNFPDGAVTLGALTLLALPPAPSIEVLLFSS